MVLKVLITNNLLTLKLLGRDIDCKLNMTEFLYTHYFVIMV